MTVAERVERLHALADGINRRFDEFVEAECADTGKPMSLARQLDIPRGAANFKIFADVVKNVPTEFFETATPDGRGAINYGHRTPAGVVGVICPWNLPLLLMTWKVGPALACGNTVVVKPSEETLQTATLLGQVMNEAGIPKGVYNVVHGFGPDSAGEFVTSHPDVDAITFTGETRTGEAIMKAAAKGARPVSLEMGGKNAAIVFADCDFDAAIEGTLRSLTSDVIAKQARQQAQYLRLDLDRNRFPARLVATRPEQRQLNCPRRLQSRWHEHLLQVTGHGARLVALGRRCGPSGVRARSTLAVRARHSRRPAERRSSPSARTLQRRTSKAGSRSCARRFHLDAARCLGVGRGNAVPRRSAGRQRRGVGSRYLAESDRLKPGKDEARGLPIGLADKLREAGNGWAAAPQKARTSQVDYLLSDKRVASPRAAEAKLGVTYCVSYSM
jgi:hypothetical protein